MKYTITLTSDEIACLRNALRTQESTLMRLGNEHPVREATQTYYREARAARALLASLPKP